MKIFNFLFLGGWRVVAVVNIPNQTSTLRVWNYYDSLCCELLKVGGVLGMRFLAPFFRASGNRILSQAALDEPRTAGSVKDLMIKDS